jgi:thiol:disulfide interchange protein DsbD
MIAFIFQFTPDGGPLPLEIIFKIKREFQLSRRKESKTRTYYNDIF